MTDRELLELAAKAAGIETRPEYASMENGYGLNVKPGYYWNPLTDDGDALRLAVKLHIDLRINNGVAEAVWINEEISATYSLEEPCDEAFEGLEAKFAATRRAIVRAAAEIGKTM